MKYIQEITTEVTLAEKIDTPSLINDIKKFADINKELEEATNSNTKEMD